MKKLITVIGAFVLIAGGQKALSQNKPINLYAFIQVAQTKLDSSKWKEALPLWEHIVQQNPVNAEYCMNLATAYYENKQYTAAIPFFKKSLALGFEFKWERATDIAHCYAQLKQQDSCYSWVKRSMQMGNPHIEQLKTDSLFMPYYKSPAFVKLLWLNNTKGMSRVQGWSYDIDFLYWQIKRVAFNPYRNYTSDDFDREVARIKKSIPTSTDTQLTVALMKLIAMVGDGHSQLAAAMNDEKLKSNQILPFYFKFYEEGLYIIAADSLHQHMNGAKILTFDGLPINQVVEKLKPYISTDNDQWVNFIEAWQLRYLPLLHAMGIANHDNSVYLSYRDTLGNINKALVNTISKNDLRLDAANYYFPTGWKDVFKKHKTQVLYLKHPEKFFWYEYLPKKNIVYFKFNQVMEKKGETLADFTKQLFHFIDSNKVEKLVIDVRDNGGGDTNLLTPLLQALMSNQKINQKGHLFCIIGKHTFSACQNFTTYLEKFTNVIFAGEPTGSSPNFIGEINWFTLPYSGLRANISNLYWQTSYPWDNRTWIAPQLYAPPTMKALREGKDDAMEAILKL